MQPRFFMSAGGHREVMNITELLEENEASKELFDAVQVVIARIGTANIRITKSQVSVWRKRAFAWVWIPTQYLRRNGLAPLVLTMSFSNPDESPRWKEITKPASGRFTHQLELWKRSDVDAEVEAWLYKAWDEAG